MSLALQHGGLAGQLRQPARMLRRHPGVARLLVVAALVLLWEISARWWIDPIFLSPPSQVVAGFGETIGTPGVPAALRIPFWELAVAFAMSVAIGLVVGLAVGLSRFGNRSFMPI